jgi:methylmalonyl-CoA/ethylmalonyl-CoA epimerase
MPKKLEHIGIAVRNLEASEALFTKLLGIEPYKREEVSSEGVMTSFFLLGDIKFELLAATNQDSPIAKFIEKRGEGIHHLAFESENLENELSERKSQNVELIHQQPKDGADNKRIAFLHPKSTGGVLWELCQEKLTD